MQRATAPRRPERGSAVLVVGAGPTGLLLAAELRRRRIDCLLIDAHDAPLGWDRATVVHERSIEIFESLGLLDRLLDRAVKVRGARLRSDAGTVGELDLSLAGSRYGFDLGVSEDVVESVLTQFLREQGGAVTRATRLVAIRAQADRVVATVEQAGERQDVVTSWLVGCDGYQSTTRKLAGIEYPGTDLEVPWAVFDASIDGWPDDYDMNFAHFDLPPVILCPLPEQRWRVYLRPTSDASDIVTDAITTIHRYAPLVQFAAVENPIRFRCHSRVASRFRSGRVVLAGDAAHVCSPAEGHGMNTGLQDAFNLGWKLALACRGMNGSALLDSYEEERRPVALRIVASGDMFESNQAMTGQRERTERDVVMRQTFADRQLAHHEAVAAAELDRSYADSVLVRGDGNDLLAPGALLPDAIPVQTDGGAECALHELTYRPGHTVFVIGGRHATCEDVLNTTVRLDETLVASPVIGAVIGLCAEPADQRIGRIDAAAADELGVDGMTILAVRPDRFVGFRHDGGDLAQLGGYLDAFTS
jgi:2-polyprenyl-6-methoxyphenol hydroxylase-like FAD-dependent oxidoreductase